MGRHDDSDFRQETPMTISSTIVRSPGNGATTGTDWSVDRMEAAVPVEAPVPDIPAGASGAKALEQTWPNTFVPPSIKGAPYDAMCKVFYRNGSVDYVASGWIVTGNTGRKGIITSGHVVYDKGQWSKDYCVRRQYSNGSWSETFLGGFARTLHGWIHSTGLRTFWDIGAIIPDDPIPEQTPALTIARGYDPNQPPFNFYRDTGYPAKPANGYPFDGKFLWESAGPLKDVHGKHGHLVLEAYNAMEQGSSGSPWLSYDALRQHYVVSGIQSSGWDGTPTSYSPYFDDRNIVALLRDIGVVA